MSRRRRISGRRFVLACLVGLVVGVGAFLLTGMYPRHMYMGFCSAIVQPGFDPLTGLPHGETLYCTPLNVAGPQPTPTTTLLPMPDDLADRWAIPIPLGFVIGAGLVLVVPTLWAARRR